HGRKRYSMKAHLADFALCAARTTPSEVSYHGITLFLVPMKNPGIRVEPLFNLSHERFCDVTLDGIRLTRADVLGDVDDGWQVINQVLPLERTGIDYAAKACRLLEGLLRHAAKTGQLDDPACAQRLLELDAQAQAARLLAWRCVANLRDGAPDDVQSAIAKWHTTELAKQLAREALELTGLAGVLRAGEDQAPEGGLFEHAYREAPGLTLAGGTSEIMLYFIAASGLGLLS
ncbi:MAG: acyl-CoA dehydrogenase family protein, partial [Micromonosporaceae bacterium]